MSNENAAEPFFSKIEIMRQNWKHGNSYSYIMNTRPLWGLCYIIKGEIKYKCKNKDISAKAGDIALLKKDSHYCAVFAGSDVEDILINFDCDKSVFSKEEDVEIIENRSDIGKSFSDIADYAIGNERKYMINSIFYFILDSISEPVKESGLAAEIKHIIMSDTSFALSENEIAKMCAVSVSTIQRTFKNVYKKTIAEYRSEFRIESAKILLLSNRYSIEEISEKLNYCDCAYFSKCFKKSTGISPKKYASLHGALPYF